MPGRDVFRKLTLQADATEKAMTDGAIIFVSSHDVPSQHGQHCEAAMRPQPTRIFVAGSKVNIKSY
jgi:hypothetical protein